MWTRFRVLLMASVLLSLSFSGVASAQESPETATVTVFHAVPADDGFPADVYLNGKLIIDGFVFATSTDPAPIPAGESSIEIYPQDADPSSDDPALVSSVNIQPDRNYSIVAQILDGAPVLSVFANDVTPVEAGEARLTVRQTSGIPEIDVSLDGQSLVAGLASTNESTALVDPGSRQVAFVQQGRALAEESVSLQEGALTVLYAIGTDRQSFGVLQQRISGLDTMPSGVPSGSGGMKAQDSVASLTTGIAVAVLLVSVALVFRRRVS